MINSAKDKAKCEGKLGRLDALKLGSSNKNTLVIVLIRAIGTSASGAKSSFGLVPTKY